MLHYLHGNATEPIETPAIIAHIVNNKGEWKTSFTDALSKKWPVAKEKYRRWHTEQNAFMQWYTEGYTFAQSVAACPNPFELGKVQIVPAVKGTIWVANMLAWDKLADKYNQQSVAYASLAKCLTIVDEFALANNHASIHIPHTICGAGDCKWTVIRHLLLRLKSDIFVYDWL